MKRLICVIASSIMVLGIITGCVSTIPRSFQLGPAPSWSTIEIRDGLTYDRAWDTVLDLVIGTFELDLALREEGIIQTRWLHTWSGKYQSNYRVRVTVKFSPDRTRLQFRSEAQSLAGRDWLVGTDSRLVSTFKTDLMGTVGRTTR